MGQPDGRDIYVNVLCEYHSIKVETNELNFNWLHLQYPLMLVEMVAVREEALNKISWKNWNIRQTDEKHGLIWFKC